MKILFISRHIPYEQNSGITIRTYNLLKCLIGVSDVSCVFLTRNNGKTTENKLSLCDLKVINYMLKEIEFSDISLLRYANNLWNVLFITRNVKKGLDKIIKIEKPDLVWLEFGYMAHFAPFIKKKYNIPIYYGSHNYQLGLDYQIWKIKNNTLQKLKMLPFLMLQWIHQNIFFRNVDRFVCISEEDKNAYQKILPEIKFDILPFIFDDCFLTGSHKFESDTQFICIIGSLKSYQNFAATVFFLKHIWPQINSRIETLKFYIVGSLPEKSTIEADILYQLIQQSKNVVLTGYVQSVVPYVKAAILNVVPITIGSGVRTKIIESVACKTAVVSTSIGASGLPFKDGKNISIADSPEEFAKKCIMLIETPPLRNNMIRASYKTYQDNLSYNAGLKLIRKILGL